MVIPNHQFGNHQGSVTMRTAEGRQYQIAGMVWNYWAKYWTGKDELIPPLHYLRMGGGEDLIFVSGVSEQALDGFLTAVKSAPELGFQKQGDWWLQTNQWFGHWTTFQVTVRPTLSAINSTQRPPKPNQTEEINLDDSQQTDEEDLSKIIEQMRRNASKQKRGWERWGSRNEGSAK